MKIRCGANDSRTSPWRPAGTTHPCAHPSTVTGCRGSPSRLALHPGLTFSRIVRTASEPDAPPMDRTRSVGSHVVTSTGAADVALPPWPPCSVRVRGPNSAEAIIRTPTVPAGTVTGPHTARSSASPATSAALVPDTDVG